MIAYDLDGVFVPNLDFERGVQKSLLMFRRFYMFPIFIPEGPYYMITGRPVSDRMDTKFWIEFMMHDNKPVKLFHDNQKLENVITYKAKILNENKEITMFVESEREQCKSLVPLVRNDCMIVCFKDIILDKLKNIEIEFNC